MQFVPGVARCAARRSSKAALFISALFAAIVATVLVAAPAASAALPGGLSSPPGLEAEAPKPAAPPAGESTVTPEEDGTGGAAEAGYETGVTEPARLVRGRAIAPANAPAVIKRVIAAGNHIRNRPYIWGGGHGRWQSRGYDCSGSVSFALHGGRLLASPETSGSLERFGEPGPGNWITIYANAQHVYMVVAGLRFDTAGDSRGTGPRWHPDTRAAAGGRFVVRHPVGY